MEKILFATMQVGPSYDPLFYDIYAPLILIIIAVVILAIIGAVAVIWWLKKQIPKKKNNLDILKSRLAKGEITKEEYDKLKKEFDDA